MKKEEDGIRVYTRDIENSKFKAFRGEIQIDSDLNSVVAVLLDVKNYLEWMPDTKELEILNQESESEILYYIGTEVPWPVSDRDGVYSMKASYHPADREVEILIFAKPDRLEEKKGYVRVQRSDSVWKITDLGNGKVQVDYQVEAEPGGGIPAWLVKMKVVSIPFESLEALQKRVAENPNPGRQFNFMKE